LSSSFCCTLPDPGVDELVDPAVEHSLRIT